MDHRGAQIEFPRTTVEPLTNSRIRALFDAVDGGDIGVVEGSEDLGFAGEAGNPVGIGGEGVGEDLTATSRLSLVSVAR